MWTSIAYVVVVALISIGPVSAQSMSDERRPNIVFVYIDDLGYTDVNPYAPRPDQYYETPNVTRLAGQGMTFTNAYANAANCAPSRAALMSGQYYPLQPIYTVNSGARGKEKSREVVPAENETTLPLHKVTLAERLDSAGYATAFLGKWHLGSPPEAGPRQQGYDVNVGGTATGHPSWEGAYFKPNNNPEIDDAPEGAYMTDYLFDKATDFIHQHRDEPFYLQLSPYSVHVPLQAPEDRVSHFKQKTPIGGHNNPTYGAMIKSVDRGLGQIMETLNTLGLRQNTVLIFYSDNGGLGGYQSIGLKKNGITDNAPLKGGKGSFYEGGIRVPFIVRWPGVVRPGTTSDEPITGVDLYPTLLEATGVELPEDYALSGSSLLPVWKEVGASLKRENLYWHFPGYLQAYGPGDWRTTPVSVIRSGHWKLMKFYEDSRVELYNLEDDVGETRNLAQEQPDTRDRLLDQLNGWLQEHDAPLPTPKE